MQEWLQTRKHIPKGLAEKSKPGEKNWAKELKKFQALREEIRFLQERGEVLPRKPVEEQTAVCLQMLFASLDRVFCNEFPAACKGMDEIAIRQRARAAIEEFRADIKARLDEAINQGKAQAAQ